MSSSVRSLREHGLLDAYLEHLPPRYHAAALTPVVGVWLPVDVAEAHYRACDALHLPASVTIEIGQDVSKRVHDSSLSVAVKLAKGAGVTPWTVFAQLQKLWDRIWVGGDVAVYRLGPKEARIEVLGWTCADSAYCRTALRGVLLGITEMFCQRAYVHEHTKQLAATSLAYRVAWA